MSEQAGGLLDTKTSYHFYKDTSAQYRSSSIDPSKFTSWQNQNMYKSSYANFHSKVIVV